MEQVLIDDWLDKPLFHRLTRLTNRWLLILLKLKHRDPFSGFFLMEILLRCLHVAVWCRSCLALRRLDLWLVRLPDGETSLIVYDSMTYAMGYGNLYLYTRIDETLTSACNQVMGFLAEQLKWHGHFGRTDTRPLTFHCSAKWGVQWHDWNFVVSRYEMIWSCCANGYSAQGGLMNHLQRNH